MSLIMIQTTCYSEVEARNIARILVEKKYVACVQMSKINSFYMWEEKFYDEEEMLLSIKTKKENFEKIKSKIKELHSYDTPEIISINIDKASKEYEKFIENSC